MGYFLAFSAIQRLFCYSGVRSGFYKCDRKSDCVCYMLAMVTCPGCNSAPPPHTNTHNTFPLPLPPVTPIKVWKMDGLTGILLGTQLTLGNIMSTHSLEPDCLSPLTFHLLYMMHLMDPWWWSINIHDHQCWGLRLHTPIIILCRYECDLSPSCSLQLHITLDYSAWIISFIVFRLNLHSRLKIEAESHGHWSKISAVKSQLSRRCFTSAPRLCMGPFCMSFCPVPSQRPGEHWLSNCKPELGLI